MAAGSSLDAYVDGLLTRASDLCLLFKFEGCTYLRETWKTKKKSVRIQLMCSCFFGLPSPLGNFLALLCIPVGLT